jgi:hypothetical protein
MILRGKALGSTVVKRIFSLPFSFVRPRPTRRPLASLTLTVAPSSGSSGATVAQTLTMFDTPSNGAAMPELLKNPRTKTPIHLVKIFAMFMIDRISWFLGPALIRPCFGVLGQPGRHQMICPRSHLISAFGLLTDSSKH